MKEELPTLIVRTTTQRKKIAEGVYLLEYPKKSIPLLVHQCEGIGEWYKEMKFRDNFDGPNYWCVGCGYELPDGIAMAVRMNELEL